MTKYYHGKPGDEITNEHFRNPEQTQNLPFKSGRVGTQKSFNNDYRLQPTDKHTYPIFSSRTH